MEIEKNKAEAKAIVTSWKENGLSVGFVPTMGALHEGHLMLIRASQKENDKTVCSIFVNPLQFNRKEDLENYPNTMEQDLEMLENEGCDLVFVPNAEAFYDGVVIPTYDFGLLGKTMEALHRPGHFEGVAAVINEFFKTLLPTRAYFGEKDFQQLAIIKWLVAKENFPVNIVACKTVRAESGLALSSRNLRLSADGRQLAASIYETLHYCKNSKSNFSPTTLVTSAIDKLKNTFDVEYFEIVDGENFQQVDKWEESANPRAFVAAHLEGVRLIDNLSLNP